MTLETEQHVEQTWGSHQPVLRAVLEVLEPEEAIELGCGNYSTPHLQACVGDLLTVEHDPNWATKILQKHPARDGHKWIVHPFRCENATAIADLPEGEWEAINDFYKSLAATMTHCDFLFVDTFRAARVPAVLKMAKLADVVLLHDLEGNSPQYYEYDRLGHFLEHSNPYHYMHRPEGMVNGIHKVPWTALYSRRSLPLEEMNMVIHRESERLWGVVSEMVKTSQHGEEYIID